MEQHTNKMTQIKGRLSSKAVKQIADLAGVSKSTVYDVLSGRRRNIFLYDAILAVLEEEVTIQKDFDGKIDKLLS